MTAKHRSLGFTLTELLVVVAVILILLAVLIVGVDGVYTRGMQLKCQHNLEQIGQASQMYAAANRGWALAAWDYVAYRAWYDTLVRCNYLDQVGVLQCPLSDIAVSATSGGQTADMPTNLGTGISKALDWLNAHQRADGGWDSGLGHLDQDRGTSGLAILAFLGYGATESSPAKYKDCVRKGLDYLATQQVSGGNFTNTYIDYTQGICTMALSDAVTMGMERFRPYAQKALNYLANRQGRQNYGGFTESSTANDMSATGWGYQGLIAARRAGLSPTDTYPSSDCYAATQGWAKTWATIDSISDAMLRMSIQINKSSLGYPDDYHSVYTYSSNGYGHGTTSAHRMTAVNLAIRLLSGHKPAGNNSPRTYSSDENCYNQLQWLTRTEAGHDKPEHLYYLDNVPPGAGELSGFDLYNCYYQTMSLWFVGGSTWSTYRDIARDKILGKQSADGSFATAYGPYGGSWGGMAYTTALGALTLELIGGDFIAGSKWTRAGDYSYGYNPLVGNTAITASPDTVILMDYTRSIIETADPAKYFAPRHGGKINVLCADGAVRLLSPEAITPGMLTPCPGD